MLTCCHDNGITPIVTLHHFTSLRWTMRLGGWESTEIIARFARYAERIAHDLGDLIPYYCTINEANLPSLLKVMMATPPHEGDAPVGADMSAMCNPRETPWWQECAHRMGTAPERLNPFLFSNTPNARAIICRAHEAVRQAIEQIRPEAEVGITLALVDMQSHSGDQAAQRIWDDILYSFAPHLRDDDFLGVQNYSRLLVGPEGPPLPELELTQMGYEFYPKALARVLHEASKLGPPMIVTENSVVTDDDARRVEFIERALAGVQTCLRDGADVHGYIYWSALDNFVRMDAGLQDALRADCCRSRYTSAHGEAQRAPSGRNRASVARRIVPGVAQICGSPTGELSRRAELPERPKSCLRMRASNSSIGARLLCVRPRLCGDDRE